MRGKSSIGILFVSLLLVSLVMVNMGFVDYARGSAGTKMYVYPETVRAPPGESVGFSVRISTSENVTSWELKLGYNTTVLKFPPNVTEGSFLSSIGSTRFFVTENAMYGYVLLGCSLEEDGYATGNGTLATFEIEVLDVTEEGITYPLEIFEASVIDYEGNVITPDTQDGFFDNLHPVAKFSWTPLMPLVNQTIMFDASRSYNVTDTLIQYYMWDFGDGTPVTKTTSPLIGRCYTSYGTYNITLTVIDTQKYNGSTWRVLKMERDIAVTAIYPTLSPSTAFEVPWGQEVTFLVTVENFGTYAETFNVTLLVYNSTNNDYYWAKPHPNLVTNLEPGAEKNITFTWDSHVADKIGHRVRAYAIPIPDETDKTNNAEYTDIDIVAWKLFIDPDEVVMDTPIANCTTFKVAVKLNYVENLYGFQFNLTWSRWDSNVLLNLEKIDVKVDKLWCSSYYINETNNEDWYWIGATSLDPDKGFNGTAVLVELTFHIKFWMQPCIPCDWRNSTIAINATGQAKFSDYNGTSIPLVVEDGLFAMHASRPKFEIKAQPPHGYVINETEYIIMNGTEAYIGNTFTVDIWLLNATKVHDYKLNMTWDTEYMRLEYTGVIFKKDFFKEPIETLTWSAKPGFLSVYAKQESWAEPAHGNGILFSLTFNVNGTKYPFAWKENKTEHLESWINITYGELSVKCPEESLITTVCADYGPECPTDPGSYKRTVTVTRTMDLSTEIGGLSDGAVIEVRPGTYTETPLVITLNDIILYSGKYGKVIPNGAVILGGIHVKGNNVTINGFNITGGCAMPGFATESIGIGVEDVADVNILQNTLSGPYPTTLSRGILAGIYGQLTANLTIDCNKIYNWTTGIFFNPRQNNTLVTNNKIYNCSGGISNDAHGTGIIKYLYNEIHHNEGGMGFADPLGDGLVGLTEFHYNSIHDNKLGGAGWFSGPMVNGTLNWWGEANGPGGVGPGDGDAVSDDVLYDPWISCAIAVNNAKYEFWPKPGDVDNDGNCGIKDLRLVAKNFCTALPLYDLNDDKHVDIFDLVLVAKQICENPY